MIIMASGKCEACKGNFSHNDWEQTVSVHCTRCGCKQRVCTRCRRVRKDRCPCGGKQLDQFQTAAKKGQIF